MRKKGLALLLTAAMVCSLGLAGCGGSSSDTAENGGGTATASNASDLQVDSATDAVSSKDTLTIAMPSDPQHMTMWHRS